MKYTCIASVGPCPCPSLPPLQTRYVLTVPSHRLPSITSRPVPPYMTLLWLLLRPSLCIRLSRGAREVAHLMRCFFGRHPDDICLTGEPISQRHDQTDDETGASIGTHLCSAAGLQHHLKHISSAACPTLRVDEGAYDVMKVMASSLHLVFMRRSGARREHTCVSSVKIKVVRKEEPRGSENGISWLVRAAGTVFP